MFAALEQRDRSGAQRLRCVEKTAAGHRRRLRRPRRSRLQPFGHIAEQVVKAVRIGRRERDLPAAAAARFGRPCGRLSRRQRRPPFVLSRQPHGRAEHPTEALAKFLRLQPAHRIDRQGRAGMAARIGVHHLRVERLWHFRLQQQRLRPARHGAQ